MNTRVKSLVATAFYVLLFAGCSGGSGSGAPVDNTPPPTLSSDATLSNLQLSGIVLDQVFQASVVSYTASVEHRVSSTTVTATSTNSRATLTVNGVAVTSGSPGDPINLIEGSNSVSILVTAEDGATNRTYTVDVTRQSPPALSSDATLSDLSVSAGDFDQVFQPGVTSYTGTASFLTTSTTIEAKTSDPSATLTIDSVPISSGTASNAFQLVEGSNVFAVEVTAEDGVSTLTYTVDYTRRAVTSFAQQAYVKASNTGTGDGFGYAVALSGNTLAVSARNEHSGTTGVDGNQADNSEPGAGAVYVFTRDAAGVWSQQAYIKASTVDQEDWFGYSIALDGDILAVGAIGDDSSATGIDGDQSDNSAFQAGAVYVFARDGAGTWSQQAYVKASNAESTDVFGISVALAGNTLAVGAYGEDSPSTGVNGDQGNYPLDPNEPRPPLDSGAAYVFIRDNLGVWSQQAYIKASNPGYTDWFGYSVALSGDTLAVGARHEDSAATGINGDQGDDSKLRSGAVYVFTRDASDSWSQQAYVKASNTDADDWFGESLALDGDTLAVVAAGEDSPASGIDGDQADDSATDVGAAYVFTRNAAGVWSQQSYIKASNAAASDYFGKSVALYRDTLAISASDDSAATGINGDQANDNASNSGAVYLFVRGQADTWSQRAYVKTSNSEAQDGAGLADGRAIALGSEMMIIGAAGEDSSAIGIGGDQADNSVGGSGAVYVYE